MADMEQDHTQPETPANTQNLVDLGTSLIQREEGRVYVLTIVGQIEGHQLLPSGMKSTKYEHVLPLLAAVEGDPDIHGLLILLNNAGGDVEAGLAIAELIASMSKPTASLVQPLQRRASGGGGPAVLHRPLRRHDGASGAADRPGHRRAPDLLLF